MSRQSAGLQNDSSEVLTAARTLLADESGKTFFLGTAAGFAVTLPLPDLGLQFEFYVKTAPTGSYTIVTNGSANVMVGQGASSDLNAASDTDFETSGGDTFTFVLNKAVKGDYAIFRSDGTSWYVLWNTSVFDAATITTAS